MGEPVPNPSAEPTKPLPHASLTMRAPVFAAVPDTAASAATPTLTPADLAPSTLEPAEQPGDALTERTIEPQTIDATGAWYSPGVALIVAALALAWQLTTTYAEELLPRKLETGAPLDRFDTMVDALPLVGTTFGIIIGAVLVLAAIGLLATGHRRGIRQPALQASVGLFALAALAAPRLLG